MDRLDAMKMLVTVVDAGSLSAAGRGLNVPLTTLSRKISALEARLGTHLLLRSTRRLALTDAGIAYVAAARRILDEVEEAERAAAGEFTLPRGELVLTAPVMFGRLHVLPVVADFLAAFPDIRVRLILVDHTLDLVDAHVDMAVRIGALPDSSMVATRIGLMRAVVCASPALLADGGMPATPDDLAGLPCIGLDTPLSSSIWRFRGKGRMRVTDVRVTPRLSVTTTDAVVSAAIRGIGFAQLLHYQVSQAVRDGALRIVLEAFERLPVPISLLHVPRGQMPLKMRCFLDFATPRLRQRMAPPQPMRD